TASATGAPPSTTGSPPSTTAPVAGAPSSAAVGRRTSAGGPALTRPLTG
ncbi:hypothetical protein A2U01_0114860, partial [Trifolium medium]|nr:hypothetical protein [Trifolium medium]